MSDVSSTNPPSPSPAPTPASSSSSSPAEQPPRKYTKVQQPFLVQKKYLAAQKAKKEEELQRAKTKSGAAGAKKDENKMDAGPWTIFKTAFAMIAVGFAISSITSYGMTKTLFWGDDLKQLIPGNPFRDAFSYKTPPRVWSPAEPAEPEVPKEKVFSVEELAMHDGSIDGYPPYVALKGVVYDVSAGAATYGPGGSYHFFAGRDATRAYITGCFETHLTHDIRGLDKPMDIDGLKNWEAFFAGSEKYHRVGTVDLPEIDPDSPLPEPCRPTKSH